MPYVDANGVLVQDGRFTIKNVFYKVVDFFYLFYRTMIDGYYDRSTHRRYIQGGGTSDDQSRPRPRMGGFGPSGDSPYSPPPACSSCSTCG